MGHQIPGARLRAAVVLIDQEAIALIERVRKGRTYYLFPGGGVEPGETPQVAAVRECREELGLDVQVGELLATVQFGSASLQLYFAATVMGGTWGAGSGEEYAGSLKPEVGTYRPCWLPMRHLLGRDVRPVGLVEALMRSDDVRWPLQIVE